MASCVAVEHIVADYHAKDGIARAHRLDGYTERSGGLIALIHDPFDVISELLLVYLSHGMIAIPLKGISKGP